jgi:hypothetical protein
MQNQRPYLSHSDLVLNLMKCIGPAATAEDDDEQLNQHSPAMLKKTRPISTNSDTPAGDLLSDTAGNGRAAVEKKQAIVSDEVEWPVDAEMFSAAEISEMATLLLRMILELCGGHSPLPNYVFALRNPAAEHKLCCMQLMTNSV